MFVFGVIWLLLGLFRGRPAPAWLRILLLLVGMALGTSIVILAAHALSTPPNLTPPTPQQSATNRQIARHFYVIFGIELFAILLAALVLNAVRYPDYILCAIALIVGIHFVPLAALFKLPFYYGTALCGSAIGLVGFSMADASLRQKVVGISFGLTLWATATRIAWLGLTAPRVVRILPM
jgi:hypothetical protein